MHPVLRNTLAVATLALAGQASAQIIFFERENFEGRSFSTETAVDNLDRYGFNNRASSVVVARDRWEICDNIRYGGRCVVLTQGRYDSLFAMGLNDRISSARTLSPYAEIEQRQVAVLVPPHDYRRRHDERLYEANVTSVRAIVGPPEQRCWLEKEQVAEDRSNANVPAAIAGALIGGILGHQVGGGRGQDIATLGGAVAGAAVGSNLGRDNGKPQGQTREVQRCTTTPNRAKPDYWDVTYDFRGQEHRVQLTRPPGRTVTVDGWGEPRE